MNKLKHLLLKFPSLNSSIQWLYLTLKRLNLYIKRIAYSFYLLFEIESNSIVIVSFYGRGFGDNAASIVNELLTIDVDFKIYWAVSDKHQTNSLPSGVIPIKYGSREFYKYMSISRFWIDNSRKYEHPFKRRKQIYIQLWHGGIALKKIEKDADDTLSSFYISNAKKDSKMIDLFTSNSKFQTQLIKNSFWYNGLIYEVGTPRVDELMYKAQMSESIKVRLRLHNYEKIILYAPTFRNNFSEKNFLENYNLLTNVFEGEKTALLLRYHPNDIDNINIDDSNNIFNVSSYPDLNDLLVVSDILITDYSSVMFEYSYLKKPVFLLIKDKEDYNSERGFYFNLGELPFSIAYSDSELIKNINLFDSFDYQQSLTAFYDKLGLIEEGSATNKIVNYIIEKVEEGDR